MNILITGTNSGIGKAIKNHYIKNHVVFGMDINGSGLIVDVSNKQAVKKSKETIPTGIDVIINAAGIMPFEESEMVWKTNFGGVVNICEAYLPKMNKNSVIINIASISGMRAEEDLPIYAASKAAVISYTKSMAKQLAPKIRVNSISPGFFDTNLVEEDTPQGMLDLVPMRREGDPKEIIPVVDMIIRSKYMTGSNIVIDGGDLL